MDIFKRSLAPITQKAWEEINETAIDIIKPTLTGRKFVDIKGPHGLGFASVPLGKLTIPEKQEGSLKYGVHQVSPLIEPRIQFKLKTWELDNIERGSKDPELEPLEDAARKIAGFEENAIYYGIAHINGLKKASEHPELAFTDVAEEFAAIVSEGIINFKNAGVEGPYTLVVNSETYKRISGNIRGYPILKQLENLLSGKVILNTNNRENFLISERGGDFELTLGQDFSIGYEAHNINEVVLFITESFTFRVIDPNAVIVIK